MTHPKITTTILKSPEDDQVSNYRACARLLWMGGVCLIRMGLVVVVVGHGLLGDPWLFACIVFSRSLCIFHDWPWLYMYPYIYIYIPGERSRYICLHVYVCWCECATHTSIYMVQSADLSIYKYIYTYTYLYTHNRRR